MTVKAGTKLKVLKSIKGYRAEDFAPFEVFESGDVCCARDCPLCAERLDAQRMPLSS